VGGELGEVIAQCGQGARRPGGQVRETELRRDECEAFVLGEVSEVLNVQRGKR